MVSVFDLSRFCGFCLGIMDLHVSIRVLWINLSVKESSSKSKIELLKLEMLISEIVWKHC